MIDYKTFLSVLDPDRAAITRDNWNWQNNIIEEIKRWMERENLTISQAFKIIDADFDGLIGRKDLRTYLNKVLGIKKHILTSEKINRLFKILDFHNRSNVQLIDFEGALTKHTDNAKPNRKVSRH